MTDFLLDTNVVSETARPRPAERVLRWIAARNRLMVSSVTWFEIRRGIAQAQARRRRALEIWLESWTASGLEVLALDREAAGEAARIELEARRQRRKVEFRDLFILATAAACGLAVATRNVSDFEGLGVLVVDPFSP